MKGCMVAAAAVAMIANAACGAALTEKEAKGFKVKQTFFSETYEDAGAKLEGAPKIVRAPISNGLLELTGQAVYSTSGSLEFGFPKRHFMTPKDGRKYFAFGFRLYSLEGGSAEMLCTSATSAFSAKFSQSTNEAFLCQIYDCGRKPRRFEIPMASLPTDVMLYAKWAKKSSSTTTSTSPKTGDPIGDIVAALSATAAVALCLALLAASRRR